jgi:hypothetical protein
MKSKSIFLLLSICILCSCHSGNKNAGKKKSANLPKDSLVQKYENEYFSIMCPQGWTSEWEDYVPETEDVARVFDSLGVKGGSVELWSPDKRMGVKLVKSVAAWLNPYGDPKQWCELSAYGRQQEEECVGMSEITDSIIIEGYPAAEITFAYHYGQDTCMQTQYAIVPKVNELYYANLKYIKGDEEAYYVGWKMLHTLHLKVK